MAVDIIPTTSKVGAFSQTVELSGETFRLDFRFNTRDGRWFIDIFDDEDTEIRRGVKVLTNWTMLRAWTDGGRPPGDLQVFRSDTDDDLGEDELGELIELFYVVA